MTIEPLSGYRHIIAAPLTYIDTALAKFGLNADPFLTGISEVPKGLQLALFGRCEFADYVRLGNS